jgi:pilus assembly protein Flp/PilA
MLELYVRLQNYLEAEEGQTLTEYALILVLVSIVVVVALTALGGQINTVFQTITARLGVGGT